MAVTFMTIPTTGGFNAKLSALTLTSNKNHKNDVNKRHTSTSLHKNCVNDNDFYDPTHSVALLLFPLLKRVY